MSEPPKKPTNVPTGLLLALACVFSLLSLMHLWNFLHLPAHVISHWQWVFDYCLDPVLAIGSLVLYLRQRTAEKAAK